VVQNIKGTNYTLVDWNAVAQNIKGTNSNLADCNAVAQNIKGTNSNYRLQCSRAKYKGN
jgi:hypothetical protein